MVNKKLLIGVGGMLVGGALVVAGLVRIPALPVILILVGGAVGFVSNRIYKTRNNKPEGLNFG